MGAFLGNLPVVYHKDLVGIFNGRQPVGNGDHRLAPRQLGDRRLDQVFVFRIDACGGLVQDDNGGVLQDGPRNGDPLLLAARKGGPALAYDRVIALRELFNERVAAGFFAAATISSIVASGFPNRMLFKTVSWKR